MRARLTIKERIIMILSWFPGLTECSECGRLIKGQDGDMCSWNCQSHHDWIMRGEE